MLVRGGFLPCAKSLVPLAAVLKKRPDQIPQRDSSDGFTGWGKVRPCLPDPARPFATAGIEADLACIKGAGDQRRRTSPADDLHPILSADEAP